MGNQLSTCFGCCPREENDDDNTAYDETSPLLGAGNASTNGLPYNRGGGVNEDQTSPHQDASLRPGSYMARGGDHRGSYFSDNANNAAAEEPNVLSEILEDGADTIIDCNDASNNKVTASGAANDGNQAKAAMYGKRLSAVASALAAKHLPSPAKPNGTGGMADLGEDGEQALNEPPEDVLSEADQVLANEVASRVHETVVDFRVEANPNLVVPFGARSHVNT